jgi:hypothetical protein
LERCTWYNFIWLERCIWCNFIWWRGVTDTTLYD